MSSTTPGGRRSSPDRRADHQFQGVAVLGDLGRQAGDVEARLLDDLFGLGDIQPRIDAGVEASLDHRRGWPDRWPSCPARSSCMRAVGAERQVVGGDFRNQGDLGGVAGRLGGEILVLGGAGEVAHLAEQVELIGADAAR